MANPHNGEIVSPANKLKQVTISIGMSAFIPRDGAQGTGDSLDDTLTFTVTPETEQNDVLREVMNRLHFLMHTALKHKPKAIIVPQKGILN